MGFVMVCYKPVWKPAKWMRFDPLQVHADMQSSSQLSVGTPAGQAQGKRGN